MCWALYNVSSLPGNGNIIQSNGMKMDICMFVHIWRAISAYEKQLFAQVRVQEHSYITVREVCMLQGHFMLHCLNDIQPKFSIAGIEGFTHGALSRPELNPV